MKGDFLHFTVLVISKEDKWLHIHYSEAPNLDLNTPLGRLLSLGNDWLNLGSISPSTQLSQTRGNVRFDYFILYKKIKFVTYSNSREHPFLKSRK